MSQDSSAAQSRVSRLRSATGSALTTGLFSRKGMWVGPALTAIVIAVVGWMTMAATKNVISDCSASGRLQTGIDPIPSGWTCVTAG